MNKKAFFFFSGFIFLFANICFADVRLSFQGQLDLKEKTIDLALNIAPGTTIVAKAYQKSDKDYYFSVDLNHIKTPLFDVSSKLESTVKLISEKGLNDFIRGKISSQYSLVDYQPLGELSGEFEIKNNILQLTDFSFGHVVCNGTVDLEKPFKTDLVFNLSLIDMKDFINFWVKSKEYESTGDVSGKIWAVGPLNNLLLRGELKSSSGFVETLKFNNLTLNIEGVYPKMQIAKSMFSEMQGMSYTYEGPIDLSDHENFKNQIKALNIAPVVIDSDSRREWTIRSLTEDDSPATTEIKYLLRKDALGSKEEKGTEMLGIERKVEF